MCLWAAEHARSNAAVSELLNFLKQLCEGHIAVAQQLLREQEGADSVNIIALLVETLDALTPPVIPKLATCDTEHRTYLEGPIALIAGLIKTLNEAVQGPCARNQAVVLDGQGLELLRNILACPHELADIESISDAGERDTFLVRMRPVRVLYRRATRLITSLLEGMMMVFLLCLTFRC